MLRIKDEEFVKPAARVPGGCAQPYSAAAATHSVKAPRQKGKLLNYLRRL
jgi:hypothetical protein